MKNLLLVALGLLLLPSLTFAQSFNAGHITVQAQGSGGTIRIGETAELARLRVSNRTGQNITLNTLKLRNYGTARLDESFENLHVNQQNITVGRSVRVDSKAVYLKLEDVRIGRGDNVVLSVQGRSIFARSGRTVELGIQREEDVNATVDSAPFFGIECRDCEDVRARSKQLRAGGIYLNRRSPYRASRFYGSRRSLSDPARYYTRRNVGNQTFAQGAKGITFFSTFLNSRTDVAVDGLFLAIASGSQVSDKDGNGQTNNLDDFSDAFSDFTLFVNGRSVDSTNDFINYRGQSGLLFDSSFDIPANSQLLLTGRVTNNAVTGDRVKFNLGRTGLLDPVYLHNGDSVSPSNINGGSRSNFTSTGSSGLSINKR